MLLTNDRALHTRTHKHRAHPHHPHTHHDGPPRTTLWHTSRQQTPTTPPPAAWGVCHCTRRSRQPHLSRDPDPGHLTPATSTPCRYRRHPQQQPHSSSSSSHPTAAASFVRDTEPCMAHPHCICPEWYDNFGCVSIFYLYREFWDDWGAPTQGVLRVEVKCVGVGGCVERMYTAACVHVGCTHA